MKKNYLPSKKFTKIILISIGIIVIFFVISSLLAKKTRFTASKEKLETQKMTINQLVEKDTDGDGIPDWEEALWGTDPNKKATFGDTPDATYIEDKKKSLNIEQDDMNNQNLTETEKLAREFFSAFTAMKASGQVDATTINNFSNALGQKMVNPTLIDIYTEKDIKISKTDTKEDKTKYYNNLKGLFEKYKKQGVGNELNIVSSKLVTQSTTPNEPNNDLIKIAQAYKDFAEKGKDLPTPPSLSLYALKIVNSSNNTGTSVLNMSKVVNDPVVGISGLSQYQKYSDDLIKAVGELEAAL